MVVRCKLGFAEGKTDSIVSRHNVIADDERIGNNAEAVSSAVVAAAANGAACFQ